MKEKITVTKPYLPPREEFERYVDEIYAADWLTNNGPLCQQLEEGLKHFLGADNVNLMVNGHLALEVAIKGLGLKGEVITTPFTFASTPHALALNGIEPVFCDIRESDLTMDPEKIEALITEKTTAILPVHVYGHPCDTEKIQAIAKKHGLAVIYDAAHTFGVKKNGENLCRYGDVSMFSFHATKLFHSIEGGALVYADGARTRIFNAYKNFGIEGEERVDYIGGNAKMNEFQAAMGLANLPHVPALIKERKAITEAYRKELEEVPGIRFFYPDKENGVDYNYAYLPILIDPEKFGRTRNEVYAALKEQNIFTRRYFWPIASQFGCYREKCKSALLPVAEKAGDTVLCLPIYNGLSLDNVKEISNAVKQMKAR